MTEQNYDKEIPPGFATCMNEKDQVVGRNSGCGSKRRAPPQSFDPIHDQYRASSHKQRQSVHLAKTIMPSSINPSIMSQQQSEKCMVKRKRGRPRKQVEALNVATKETPAVPLSPVPPPSGSSINAPLLNVDEEQEDTKINLDPLSMLSPPPNPRLRTNECSSHINETSKTMISHAKSLLFYQLTKSTKNLETMVKCANNTFTLDILQADYTSFYNNVKEFIAHQYEFLATERQREMQSFPAELKTRYEEAIIRANDLNDKISHYQDGILMVTEKKETLEREIAEAMEYLRKLEQRTNNLKPDEEILKRKKENYVTAYEIAHRKVQKLFTQVEAAEEIDKRKKAALSLPLIT